MPSSAAWSAGNGIRLWLTISAPPVPIATRTSRSPKTIAATRPCEAATETCTARRPLRMLGDSSTAPAASSSLTRLDTVAALSPVTPAISTWVSAPFSRTASSTRRRFISRRDACEPGAGPVEFTG